MTGGWGRGTSALMDNDAKKTALRMIPYGLYVLTAQDADGHVAAATVNWVTQTAFEPPLVAVGVKVDSGAHAMIKSTGAFALNVLGKGQQGQAYAFFKPVERTGDMLGDEPCHTGTTGAPILDNAPAFLECKLVDTIEKGDHSLFVGEVVQAGVSKQPEGRADDATLWLKDLGEKVFYGG
jgi:flavin reductase (DIM6/NTAB) family NADH-FMN oxidoreductase RutF